MTAKTSAKAFDLSGSTVALFRSGASEVTANTPGPPRRVDGFTVGAPVMTRNAPHGGEMHPDGDELLFLLSGRADVVLEDGREPRTIALGPGEAVVIPRGVWHRVLLREPSQLLHVTPGPGGEHRPLAASC